MALNFDLFFRRVLADEGTVYEDVPGDNGGPTKCGITIADVARWNGMRCPKRGGAGWDALVAKVRALTPETASPIYKKFYWDAVRADDLPSGLDYAVVDYAVNSGVGRAVPTLARVSGVATNAIVVDDRLLQAIAQYGHIDELINHFQDERKEFLEQIAEIPHNRKFRRGWLERETRVRRVALELDRKARADTPIAAPKAKAIAPDDVGAVSAPSTQPAVMTVVKTTYQSRSIWAVLSGVASMIFGVLTDWAKEGWDWLMWAVDVVPKVKQEVDEVLSPAQEMAAWFGANIAHIAMTLSAICVCVFVWRHIQLKLEAQQSKGPTQ